MARDYKKLRTFHYADELVLEIYRATRKFPRDEIFGLTSQMRRAALSTSANIVEGCQRASESEYVNFLNIALGSAGELGYFLTVAQRLGYISKAEFQNLSEQHGICIRSLQALVSSFRARK